MSFPRICFVIDTSASMAQRSVSGIALFDIAKSVAETLAGRLRQRAAHSNSGSGGGGRERLALVDPTDDQPFWTDFGVFLRQLKDLKLTSLSNLGEQVKKAFVVSNVTRLQNSTENYGYGRLTWMTEPTMIIVITDGSLLTGADGIQTTFTMPFPTAAGSRYTSDPFRWDQRLYTIMLRFGGLNAFANDRPQNVPLALMCDVTGGKCFTVTGNKEVNAVIDVLASKFNPFVISLFDQNKSQNRPALFEPRRLSLTSRRFPNQTHPGFWPIPENYFAVPNMPDLPPRTGHPTFIVDTNPSDSTIPRKFPFDKYEVEISPLTSALITHGKFRSWAVFVEGSGRLRTQPTNPQTNVSQVVAELCPCGFLKQSSKTQRVHLFILPFNYPKLFSLLNQLSTTNIHNSQWKAQFESYLQSVPLYYIPYLRNALRLYGIAADIIPKQYDVFYCDSVNTQLQNMKLSNRVEVDMMVKHGLARAEALRTFHVNGGTNVTGNNSSMNGNGWNSENTDEQTDTVDLNTFDVPRNFLLRTLAQLKFALHEEENKLPFPTSNNENFTLTGIALTPRLGSSLLASEDETLNNPVTPLHSPLLTRADTPILGGLTLSTAQQFHTNVSHRLPIALMSDYVPVLRKHDESALRAVFDDSNDDRFKRAQLFGNPFRVLEKRNEDIADPVLNEARIEDLTQTCSSPTSTKHRRLLGSPYKAPAPPLFSGSPLVLSETKTVPETIALESKENTHPIINTPPETPTMTPTGSFGKRNREEIAEVTSEEKVDLKREKNERKRESESETLKKYAEYDATLRLYGRHVRNREFEQANNLLMSVVSDEKWVFNKANELKSLFVHKTE